MEADSIVFGKASQEVQSPDSAHFLLSAKALLGFKQSVEFFISTSLIPYHRKSSSSVLRLSWGSRILHGKGQGFMSCNSGVTLGKSAWQLWSPPPPPRRSPGAWKGVPLLEAVPIPPCRAQETYCSGLTCGSVTPKLCDGRVFLQPWDMLPLYLSPLGKS